MKYTTTTTAVFIGGPVDGKRRQIASGESVIYVFESPKTARLSEGADALALTLLRPYVRTYRRITTTPCGVAVFEVEPLRVMTEFTVEVEHHPDSDPELIRRVVDSVVESTPNHGTAFIGGITGARVTS